MGRSRRLRRSVDNVFAEERREALRQSLPPGPLRPPPRTPVSAQGRMARRSAILLLSAAVGIAGGVLAGDRATGVALGIAAGIGVEAAMRQRD
jgi:hypothetical protein